MKQDFVKIKDLFFVKKEKHMVPTGINVHGYTAVHAEKTYLSFKILLKIYYVVIPAFKDSHFLFSEEAGFFFPVL